MIEGKRVRISSAVYDWEKHGDLNDPYNPPHVNVNEGPQILKNKKKLFLIYSASGCWTENYSLGMLTFTGKKIYWILLYGRNQLSLYLTSQ